MERTMYTSHNFENKGISGCGAAPTRKVMFIMVFMMGLGFFTFSGGISEGTAARIFECVDQAGRPVFTDSPTQLHGCKPFGKKAREIKTTGIAPSTKSEVLQSFRKRFGQGPSYPMWKSPSRRVQQSPSRSFPQSYPMVVGAHDLPPAISVTKFHFRPSVTPPNPSLQRWNRSSVSD